MTPLELSVKLKNCAYTLSYGYVTTAFKSIDALNEAAALLQRWESGDFTPEEIHNFCHKLPNTVSRCEFNRGCLEYQDMLYGKPDVPECAG